MVLSHWEPSLTRIGKGAKFHSGAFETCSCIPIMSRSNKNHRQVVQSIDKPH